MVIVLLFFFVCLCFFFLSKRCSNYARFSKFCYFVSILCSTKMSKTVRKMSFINISYYYYCFHDFECCFSGFKYSISSILSVLFSPCKTWKFSGLLRGWRTPFCHVVTSMRVGLGTRFSKGLGIADHLLGELTLCEVNLSFTYGVQNTNYDSIAFWQKI